MTSPGAPVPASAALEVFASWLSDRESDRESGRSGDFQDLLRCHPHLALELQALHATWAGLAVSISLASVGDTGSMSPSAKLSRLVARGSTFARYRIEGEVARGGMGAILKVWDDDLRRRLAMKVALDAGEAREADPAISATIPPKLVARFLEEAQVTGQLDHPGIVPVHEIGFDPEGRLYFTMKLVEGRDLKQIFELVFAGREGWSVTRAVGVIHKACEALAYAHKKGVIHRDLKPANVMVGSFGEVFVMDWGLARVLGRKDAHALRPAGQGSGGAPATSKAESWHVHTERSDLSESAPGSALLTAEGDVLGTAAYMPPEQARGDIESLTAQSDV
jgi:serine/threonine protein kinase